MNWYSESFYSWEKRMKQWHKWFTWYPIWSAKEERAYWLETVERRLCNYSNYLKESEYEYRGIK